MAAPNVLPRIGTLEPEGARSAIREVFLRHVIGGKGLSRGPGFASLVRAATPDAVLSGVEVLADGAPAHGVPPLGDVLVVDVGGATTDVYSVITPEGRGRDAAQGGRGPAVEVTHRRGRPRACAGGPPRPCGPRLPRGCWTVTTRAGSRPWPRRPGRRPGPAAPRPEEDVADDLGSPGWPSPWLCGGTRGHRPPPRAGKDLRRVVAVVGSGGVLRHAAGPVRGRVLSPATGDHAGGWRVPHDPVAGCRPAVCALCGGVAGPGPPACRGGARTRTPPIGETDAMRTRR